MSAEPAIQQVSAQPASSEFVPADAGATGRGDRLELTDQTNLLPTRQVVPILLGLALCIVVSTLDSVIVATALPTISTAFNAGAVVSWVPAAYLLTSTSFQPLYGRFSDIFGRKAALCTAMAVFMTGNLAAGFSHTIVQLIVLRGVAGAGGGGIVSMAQIVMSDVVSLRERGKYQGIIGGFVALGYAVGPLIGGALAQKVSWRWCIWITIPISFAAICVVVFLLRLKTVKGDIRSKLLAVDYVGAFLSLLGSALIILPLIWGGVTFPWKSAVVLAPLFSGFLVLGIFCCWEWKGAKLPIVPMYIFKHVTVSGVYITMFVNGFVFFSSLYYLPQFFQVALGYSPIRAGVFLIPLLVSMITTSWVAGVIVSRTGRYRTIIHLGFSVWAIGCGCMSTVTPSSHRAVLVIYMLLCGVGAGQTLQTTTVAAQASVPRKDMSVVTAFRNFIRLLGGTLSLAIGSTIINNALTSSMRALALPPTVIAQVVADPARLADPGALGITPAAAARVLLRGYTRGVRAVFVLNAALAAGATLASVGMIRHKELTRADDAQRRGEARRGVQGGKEKGYAGAGAEIEMGKTGEPEEPEGEKGLKE